MFCVKTITLALCRKMFWKGCKKEEDLLGGSDIKSLTRFKGIKDKIENVSRDSETILKDSSV